MYIHRLKNIRFLFISDGAFLINLNTADRRSVQTISSNLIKCLKIREANVWRQLKFWEMRYLYKI